MKKLAVGLSLCLLAATAALTLPAAGRSPAKQEVDPDTLRVLWADEEHQVPSFIPQALIGDLDLTSPETVDLSHLPMTESQKARFKFFLFVEPDGPDGCFTPPMAARRPPAATDLSIAEFVARMPLATTGVVRKVVPGWLTGVAMAGNLVFVEVDELLRDIDTVASAGQPLVFLQQAGAELVISGKRICSPKSDRFQAKIGSEVLLFGFGDDSDPDWIRGQIYEIRDATVYPYRKSEVLKASALDPIPLWKLRQQMETLAELKR